MYVLYTSVIYSSPFQGEHFYLASPRMENIPCCWSFSVLFTEIFLAIFKKNQNCQWGSRKKVKLLAQCKVLVYWRFGAAVGCLVLFFFSLTVHWLLIFYLFLWVFLVFFYCSQIWTWYFHWITHNDSDEFSWDVIAILELIGAYLLMPVPPPAINVEFDIYSSMIQLLRFYEVPSATLCRQL